MKPVEAKIRNYLCMSVSLALIWAIPLIAEAKTLYVNGSTGNDAITYANNNESNPWRSIGRAAWGSTNRSTPNATEAARAGDTVLVAAGTYSTAGTDIRYDPAYNSVNSGTSNNPITFQASGTVHLTLGNSRGPMIGSNGKDYVTWSGFSIHEATAVSRADTGPITVWGATGVIIENNTINGNGDPGYGDNHPGIRIEGSRNVTVRNNRISNFRTSVVNPVNGAGIQVYESYNLLISNNDISASGSGIFLKQLIYNATGTTTIRNNLIYNVASGGIVIHRQAVGQTTRIHNNIVRASEDGIRLWGFDTSTFPRNTIIANNTFYENNHGLYILYNLQPNAGIVFFNNIIANSMYAIQSESVPSSGVEQARFSAQHNSYYQLGTHAYISGRYTLSAWKDSLRQDIVAPEAISANPLFVDAAGGNFRLQVGSSALSLGVDVLDLNNNGSVVDTIPAGAYITGNEVIGLGSQSSDVLPPMAPANVRIQ